MGWSFNIANVRGINIRVHASFALILIWAAFYWGADTDAGARGVLFGVVATLLLFVCVTLHELGHAITAQHYGIEVRDITLLPIGGVARIEVPENPRQELWIALAGPAVNVAIAAVLIAVGAIVNESSLLMPADLSDTMRDAKWSGLLAYLTVANVGLVLFNLLPAFPLDGGRVLRALLALRLDYRRATAIAVRVGQALALGLGLLGFLSFDLFLILIAVFIWFGAEAEGQQVAVENVTGRLTVRDAMSLQPAVLAPDDPLTRAVELTLSTTQADFPVVDADGRVAGLLAADALLRGLRDQPGATVGAMMRRDVPRATPGERLVEVQQRLAAARTNVLLVVEGDRLAGLLTMADIGEAYRLFSIRPDLLAASRAGTDARRPMADRAIETPGDQEPLAPVDVVP